MDANSLSVLDAIVLDACRSLFESVGAPLDVVEIPVGTLDDVGASIGFTGSQLRGALVMISTRRLVKQVLPVKAGPDDAEQIADWMGELANQLLGRINNKLGQYGVMLQLSTPTVIFGLELSRKDTRSSIRRQFAFRHGDLPLSVWFDVVAPPDFQLSLPEQPPDAGIAEGEIALF